MNPTQYAIYIGACEEVEIRIVLFDIAENNNISRSDAFKLLQSEIDFIISRDDIYLIYSERLYDQENCQVIDKNKLKELTIDDVEFNELGPFYYLSNMPSI
jgi:hypothetical protein